MPSPTDAPEPGPTGAPPGSEGLAAHWQRIAEERRLAHEALARRPLVRAAVSLERRTAPAVASLRGRAQRARATAARAALAARALPNARHVDEALDALDRALAAVPDSSPARPPTLIPLPARPSSAEVAAELDASDADVVVLVPAGVDLLGTSAAQLAAALRPGVGLATPTVVHGRRRGLDATPVDGRVLAAGLDLVIEGGVAVPVPRHAGRSPRVADPLEPVAVAAALGAGVALDRRAALAVGGLAPVGDLDAAVVELADRLAEAGQGSVHVSTAVAVDRRPPAGPAALDRPIDPRSTSWAKVLDRRGARLRRRAEPAPGGRMELAFTIAAPSAKVAERWGDWHLAGALAAELARLGHGATVRPVDRAEQPVVRSADVHVVVRGLRSVRRTAGQGHVLWIISHPLDVAVAELDEADLVLVASRTHAAVLRERTATPVEVLLQATDHRRFRPVPPDDRHRHDVTIVAKSRERYRPVVAAAVEAGLAPAIYGGGWERFVDPALIAAHHVPNAELPVVYASAGVVLNDHWDDMRELGFVGNRIFDVLACGTPVISDHVPELVELLGDAVPTWQHPGELAALVASDLADPEGARARAARGRALVLAHHTFERRAAELVALLARHGLDPSTS